MELFNQTPPHWVSLTTTHTDTDTKVCQRYLISTNNRPQFLPVFLSASLPSSLALFSIIRASVSGSILLSPSSFSPRNQTGSGKTLENLDCFLCVILKLLAAVTVPTQSAGWVKRRCIRQASTRITVTFPPHFAAACLCYATLDKPMGVFFSVKRRCWTWRFRSNASNVSADA